MLAFVPGLDKHSSKSAQRYQEHLDQQQQGNSKFIFWAIGLSCMLLITSGCVSQSKYDSAVQETASIKKDRDDLQSRIDSLEVQKKQLESDLQSTTEKLTTTNKDLDAKNAELANANQQLKDVNSSLAMKNDLLSTTSLALETKQAELAETMQKFQATADYMKKTDKLYDDLVKQLSSELDSKSIKIKEMKDGVNVNLSEDILFSSGSANLNETGKKVIIKVSEKLKGIPHQVIVAGFTDNIPIRGGLTKKFPTNWELAGARAASVVRLLEKEGIENDKLTAVSFGENQPFASNDSADGRSQNRRIEIRLRPVE